MADVNNPRPGDVFYYLGRTQCTVVGETRQGGGVNADALVQIETISGTPIVFLHSTAERYLSLTRRPWYKTWPLTVKAVR